VKSISIRAFRPPYYLSILLAIGGPSISSAQEADDAESKFLIELGLGASAFSGRAVLPAEFSRAGISVFGNPQFILAQTPVIAPTFDDRDSIGRLSLAYRAVDNLFLEIEYNDLGEYTPSM